MDVYVSKAGEQLGPFTVEQLREYVQQGNFTSADHACYDGQNWVTIAEVPGFAEATQPAASPSPTTPQQDQAVQEHADGQQPASADASNPPSKKKKIILWTGIGGGATLLVAGLLTWLLSGDDKKTKNKNPDQPTFVTGSVATPLGPGETCLLGMWAPTKRVVIPEVIYGLKVTEIANFSQMMSGGSKGSKKLSFRAGGHIVSPFGSGAGSPRPRNNITEEIVIPGTVKKIQRGAFRGCKKLKKITFSEGLVEIEDYAFGDCNQLEAVEFPRSLRKIGPHAFNGCNKLHSIVLKEGVEMIGDHAFSKTSPKKVIFPKSLKSLGLVFEDCRKLEAIVFLGDRPVATGRKNGHTRGNLISLRTGAWVYYNPLTKRWGKRPWGLYEIPYKGGYKNNKMHGLCTWWYKNGQKSREVTYKDGQPDGLFFEWYSNGQKEKEGTYKDGKDNGLWTEWYSKGQKRREVTYKDGELLTIVDWKPDGEKFPGSIVIIERTGNVKDSGTDDLVIHTHIIGLDGTRDNVGPLYPTPKNFDNIDLDDREEGSTDIYYLPSDYPVSRIQGVELVVEKGDDAWRLETISFQLFDGEEKSKPYVFEVNQWFSAEREKKSLGAIKSKMFSFRPDSEANQSPATTPDAKIAQVTKINLDDNETRNRIIAEAIDLFKLRARNEEDEKLYYALNQQTTYTGWVKLMHDNGQIKTLASFKDGKQEGLATKWYDNGQKKSESIYKGNKQDGPSILWHSNGQKSGEYTYKDGRLITAIVWRPNGEKCPDTNVVKGNGVWVLYNEDGTEFVRHTYKDGEEAKANQSPAVLPNVKTAEVEEIDLGDPATRDKIIAEAIVKRKLEWRGKEGEELRYALNQQTPYTGWMKVMWGNGQIRWLVQFKDGKWDGLEALWYSNGQKKAENTYKAFVWGRRSGKLVTAVGWKRNGEKSDSNVVNGNGVRVSYLDDGTERGRYTYKDGKIVLARPTRISRLPD